MVTLIGVINFILGLYLAKDSIRKINTSEEILYFDNYLNGAMRYIPIILAIGMIITSVFLIVRKSSKDLLLTFINSFLFILFFTPTLFYKNNISKYLIFMMAFQIFVLFVSVILLYSKPYVSKVDKQNVRTKITYEEYKASLNKYKEDQLIKSENREENKVLKNNNPLDKLRNLIIRKKENTIQVEEDKGELLQATVNKESSNQNTEVSNDNSKVKKVDKNIENKKVDNFKKDSSKKNILLEDSDSIKKELESNIDNDTVNSYEDVLENKNVSEITNDKNNGEFSKIDEEIIIEKELEKIHEENKSKDNVLVPEIVLPKDNGKKKLRVQETTPNLDDNDVKIVEDLKDIIN